jgi:phosphoserine aminotransferase
MIMRCDGVSKAAYFGAGPAKLPEEVLLLAQDDIHDFRGVGVGILEVSHRSKEYMEMMKEAEDKLRMLVGIPEDYAVLFMPGGGTLQFAAVIFNLLGEGKAVDYLISGSWSAKAAEEAKKLVGGVVEVNEIPIFAKNPGEEAKLVDTEDWQLSSKPPAYVYYCDNETIDGIETPSSDYIPDCLASRGCSAPIVVDMSSNFLSRPVNVSKFGLIFATAQKNFGPAGVTVVIVKRSLLSSPFGSQMMTIPTMLDYRLFDKHQSLYNTPPCQAISVCYHVFSWIERHFGTLSGLAEYNAHKSQHIYNCILESDGFYRSPAPYPFKSRMNVVFNICKANGSVCAVLEDKFVRDAETVGLLGVRGHRSVGGIRVSLYNAVTAEASLCMVAFMRAFAQEHFSD